MEKYRKQPFFFNVESFYKQFSIGFLSGILNPKNMLFYFSLFTVLVSEETPLFTKYLYALWMVFVVFVWDSLVALFIGDYRIKRLFNNSIFYIEKCAGAALTLFGISLIIF